MAFGSGRTLPAASTNLHPSADTALFQASPDNNLGGMDFMPVGATSLGPVGRGLIRFNLAGVLPAGANVTNATLALTVLQAQTPGAEFALHPMLVSWNEGIGSGGGGGLGSLGAAASTGDATWNRRAHPNTQWGSPGANANVDYSATASATAAIGLTSLEFSSAQLTADINSWLASPGANHGWLIKVANEQTVRTASRIASRENTLNRPVLTLHYATPASAVSPDIFDLAKTAEQIRFSFNAQAGRSYAIDARTNVTSGWMELTSYSAPVADTTLHFTNSITGDTRYYRVRTP